MYFKFSLSQLCSTPLSHNTTDDVCDNALAYKVLQVASFNKLHCSERTNRVQTPKHGFYSNTHHTDILKHLNDGWVHEIVAWAVVEESLNDRLKEEIPHYVAIVEFILQTNDSPHEAQST